MVSDFINTFLSALALAILGKIWKATGAYRDANRIIHVLSHYTTGVVKRLRQGLPCPFYKCIGGIIVPLHAPNSAHIDMDEVPDDLYRAAEEMGMIYAKIGLVPNFDFTVEDRDDIYRICAVPEFGSHILAFYRRPRLLA